MSRSDRMPASRPPAPRITTAPIGACDSSFAAACKIRRGFDADDIAALGSQNVLDLHGSLPVQRGSPEVTNRFAARAPLSAGYRAEDAPATPGRRNDPAGHAVPSNQSCAAAQQRLRLHRAAESSNCGISGAGSNQANSRSPARKPPICACQATVSPPVSDGKRADAEHDVDAEPDGEKQQHARVAQHAGQAAAPARDRHRRRRCAACRAGRRAGRRSASPPPSCRRSPPMRRSSDTARPHASRDAAPRRPPTSRQRKPRKRSVPKRRATALPNGRNQIALTPKCIQFACRNE